MSVAMPATFLLTANEATHHQHLRHPLQTQKHPQRSPRLTTSISVLSQQTLHNSRRLTANTTVSNTSSISSTGPLRANHSILVHNKITMLQGRTLRCPRGHSPSLSSQPSLKRHMAITKTIFQQTDTCDSPASGLMKRPRLTFRERASLRLSYSALEDASSKEQVPDLSVHLPPPLPKEFVPVVAVDLLPTKVLQPLSTNETSVTETPNSKHAGGPRRSSRQIFDTIRRQAKRTLSGLRRAMSSERLNLLHSSSSTVPSSSDPLTLTSPSSQKSPTSSEFLDDGSGEPLLPTTSSNILRRRGFTRSRRSDSAAIVQSKHQSPSALLTSTCLPRVVRLPRQTSGQFGIFLTDKQQTVRISRFAPDVSEEVRRLLRIDDIVLELEGLQGADILNSGLLATRLLGKEMIQMRVVTPSR